MARHLNAVPGPVATDLEAQALALDELCPVCHVEPGQVCIGQISGQPMRASHWQRIHQATHTTGDHA